MGRGHFVLSVWSASLLGALRLGAAGLSPTAEGIAIDASAVGRFVLEYPRLGDKEVAPAERRIEGRRVSLSYPDGTAIAIELRDGGAIAFLPTGLPGATKLRFQTLVDFGFADGGQWSIDAGPLQPFPAVKPPKPFLFQGQARLLRVVRANGAGLAFGMPEYTYQQLQDNREWNWKTFAWLAWVPANRDTRELVVQVTDVAPGADTASLGPRIDRFGQDARRDWPGKVHSDEELQADASADAVYYAQFARQNLDRLGGVAGSGGELGLAKPTGFFQVARHGGRWLLLDPEGNLFFHLGICGFNPSDDYTCIEGRTDEFAWLAPLDDPLFGSAYHPNDWWHSRAFSFYVANVIRKQGKPFALAEWQAGMIERVRALGFNSGGAFSQATEAFRAASFPYVASLPLGTWQLGRQSPGLRGFFDPFDPATVARIAELFAKDLPPRAADPLLIGYFLENEQACEDIPRVMPSLGAEAPAKQRLVRFLREKHATIAAFNQAWGLEAADFEALAARGLPVTTAAAAADLEAFTGLFLEEYYRVIVETFRRHDPNHLLLGNRWQPGTANDEQLVRIAGRSMDVLSLNYYTYGFDKAYLERLHGWGGDRPWLLSEWHYASPSDSGLPGGAKDVGSQRDRGLAYRHYVEQAAALPFVVGHEWFTLIDQARAGRFFEKTGGENGNTGLFSVADRPWKELVEAASLTHRRIYGVLMGATPPFASDLPLLQVKAGSGRTVKAGRVGSNPLAIDGRLDGWPNFPPETLTDANQVVGSEKVGIGGSFRLAWDDTALYLLIEVTDPTPMRNDQTGAALWNADAIELFIGHEQLEQAGSLVFSDRQVLLGAGKPAGACRWHVVNATPGAPGCTVEAVPRVDGKGYVLEAAIPFGLLGFSPKPGLPLRFDLAIDDGATGKGRQRQIVWNGTERNSGDRGPWGRAVLAGE
jgi:hypothetical protein